MDAIVDHARPRRPDRRDPGQSDSSQPDPSQLDPSQLDPSQLDPGRRDRAAMRVAAAAVLGLAVLAIAAVFAFQFAGYAPCELCLKERLPYYAGIVLAAATLAAAFRGPRFLPVAGFFVLALVFLGSAGFGAYHAGVEWGFWPGPADCTGPLDRAASNADFLNQLQHFRAVRCDAVAIRISGLSLAGWNAVSSLLIAGLAAAGLRRGLR